MLNSIVPIFFPLSTANVAKIMLGSVKEDLNLTLKITQIIMKLTSKEMYI